MKKTVKILSAILLLFFLPNIILAQKIEEKEELFKKYGCDSCMFNKNGSKQWIVRIKKRIDADVKLLLLKHALRILNDEVYIIKDNPVTAVEAVLAEKRFANNNWKLSPLLEHRLKDNKESTTWERFIVECTGLEAAKRIIGRFSKEVDIIATSSSFPVIFIETSFIKIKELLLEEDDVVSIDIHAMPKEELGTPGFDLSANKINVVHNQYPSINGAGENVSIKEQKYDTTDIDLKGRHHPSPLQATTTTNHANFIATIIAGGGNSVHYAKGAAPGAGIFSSSFEHVLPDASAFYRQNGISVQNHSYGTAIDNSYGINAVAFDKSCNENQHFLHVFSSGNSGTTATTSGPYAGVAGFANLTGNFKMAKNPIIVGAVDSFGVFSPLSSKGPTYDGRIKPEIVAFEKNGTSEAAALVSGTSLLLFQYYKLRNNGEEPASALVKAILINSADDVNTPGPDYATGFGNMNALKAMSIIRDNTILKGSIRQGETKTFNVDVPAGVNELKVSLAWNDTVATTFANKALVNDLDLEVLTPMREAIRPWVLSSYPNTDSLSALPTRRRDSLNNVETITTANPVAGSYQIKVTGHDVITSTQHFSIAYSYDTANHFQWLYPTPGDLVQAGKENTLRWNSTVTGRGSVEYSIDKGATWRTIEANAELKTGFTRWNAPDTISGNCLLRITSRNDRFYSDTFVITSLPQPKVGFNCNDSVLIYWNKIKDIGRYQVYNLGDKYMEPLSIVNDTTVVVHKTSLRNNFLAVAPILNNGKTGTRSYGFDYSLQGAGCFILSFLATAVGSTADLQLTLGTIYGVDSVGFEILTLNGYNSVYSTPISGQQNFYFNYIGLHKGLHFFRARVKLKSGAIVYSDAVSVIYFNSEEYLLFPNPVRKNSNIILRTSMPQGETIQIADVAGRIVLEQKISVANDVIKTWKLPAGLYVYRIIKDGTSVAVGKLIVQ